MPEMNVTGATTFSQINQRFGQGSDTDHHIRFQDGKGLYTSGKASLTGIKAFFGDHTAMTDRVQKRGDGMTQIKQAIDREYNSPGLGNRVLQRLTQGGKDFSEGIRGSDLGAIRNAIADIRLEDRQAAVDATRQTRGAVPANQTLKTKADAALNDPNLANISKGGFIDPGALLTYCGTHFDVVSSPEFFAVHSQALSNSDNFGCALSLSVLERIQTNGTVTQKDLDDLHKALGPHTGLGSTAAAAPSATLLGALTDDHRSQLTKLVFDRYMAPDAPNLINWENRPFQNEVRDTFSRPTATGSERLASLRSCYAGTMSGQYMGATNMTNPLTSISNMTWGLNPMTELNGVTIA